LLGNHSEIAFIEIALLIEIEEEWILSAVNIKDGEIPA
jgi:hypothetical protein